jgi:hypothetical protein
MSNWKAWNELFKELQHRDVYCPNKFIIKKLWASKTLRIQTSKFWDSHIYKFWEHAISMYISQGVVIYIIKKQMPPKFVQVVMNSLKNIFYYGSIQFVTICEKLSFATMLCQFYN